MRKILLPLAIATGLAASSAFAFDVGGALNQADSKAQAGLDAASKAQDNANTKMNAAESSAQDKATAVDSTTGLHTADSVKNADNKVQKHKAKANKSASRAHNQGADAKAAVDAKIGGMTGAASGN
jgi:hypothetical protein